MELDLDFVGDGGHIGPRAFADVEIHALEHEAAVEDAVGAVLLEGEGGDDLFGAGPD